MNTYKTNSEQQRIDDNVSSRDNSIFSPIVALDYDNDNGTIKGRIDFRYNGSSEVTSFIREKESGILEIQGLELPEYPEYQEKTYYDERLYQGVDLTVKFADEIANFNGDAWAWIKDRINNVNYADLHICDYIPFETNDGVGHIFTHEAQIAGIDTYYETNYPTATGHHIDFITRDCYPINSWSVGSTTYITRWNTSNNNNGSSSNPYPWKASYLWSLLNNVMFNYLPSNLRSQIINKDWLLEYRYSSSGALTNSNSWEWGTLGKIWLPTETEVCGACVWGTRGYSVGTSIQYPIFANRSKIKHAGKNGDRCAW